MGGPELAVAVAIAVPILIGLWVVRFVGGLKTGQEALRARVDALERASQRQPPV